ncbi:MAG: hypothetical protein M1817_000676 [Caeruleum heppii]|nr:MAG: hypothetical protein M1817_000676 [Caeruleum heppii]
MLKRAFVTDEIHSTAHDTATHQTTSGSAKRIIQARRSPIPLQLDSRESQKRQRTLGTKPGLPWKDYQAFLKRDQAGSAVIAHRTNASFDLVAIKEVNLEDQDEVASSVRPAHKNLVTIIEIFSSKDSLYMVYEPMEISLSDIQASVLELEEPHVAAICVEVRS